MAITQGQTSVGTAAAVINTAQATPGFLHITNLDNTDTVYVGGAGVTTANGHGILKSNSIDLQCYAEQVFYAVSSKAGHSIAWILVTP